MTVLGSNQRARVNTRSPEAFAICDRCGFLYNHVDLRWQYEWRGNNLTNTRFLVCAPCYDVPFELNRPKYLPPDPVPVLNARPPQWATEEEGTGPNPDIDVIQQLIDLDQVP
jgi:hypothetical protein